jgi:hypothetical protein
MGGDLALKFLRCNQIFDHIDFNQSKKIKFFINIVYALFCDSCGNRVRMALEVSPAEQEAPVMRG